MKGKKTLMSIISLFLVACMLLPFAACGVVDATSVELDRGSLTLDIGDSQTLSAFVLPANATNATVTWRSSDPGVASVDKNGKVTGISEGNAVVKASIGKLSATCNVTVYDSSKMAVEVTSVTLAPNMLDLTPDSKVAIITPTVAPQNATNKSLTWSSSNDKLVSVQNGVVSVVGSGNYTTPETVNITATAHNGEYGICMVRVSGDFTSNDNPDTTIHVQSVTVSPDTLQLIVGRTGQLSAQVLPDNATDKSVTWHSDDDSIASVVDGIVTANAQGQTTIYATSVQDGDVKGQCTVTVREASQDDVNVTNVMLNKSSLALNVTQTETLKATVLPANATDKNVSWSSSAPTVANVDANGLVTALDEGTAVITVTTSDGGKTATCTVNVTYAQASSITIAPSGGLTLDSIGKSGTLTATVMPATAKQGVTWQSDNTNVAVVNPNGLVTAVGYGTANITATSQDGKASQSVVVTVKLSSDDIYVAKVDALSDRSVEFIMGMDASAVPSLENAGVTYKNFAGEVEDVFKILKDNGITDIRIRIWNNPYTDSSSKYGAGHSYGGGNCDIDNAVAIARRCEAVGLGVIIDFHYSDFWADPGNQTIPKAWKQYASNTDKIAELIGQFTEDCLQQIKDTGVQITMVQIGNETNAGMAGTTNSWTTVSKYMNAGSAAVRKVTGQVSAGGAKVALHFTNPEAMDYLSKAGNVDTVDYDVFGTSYYPYWHGTLDNLSAQLAAVHKNFGKEVMVLETSYAFTQTDFDGCGNTGLTTTPYPVSVQGQANSVLSVIKTVANLGDYGLGVCYWEGTWLPATTSNNGQTNSDRCLQYGCGWASYYANEYDSGVNQSKDWWNGCVIDNQAFFMPDGTPLESLKVFALAKDGNAIGVKADQYEDQEGYYTVNVGPVTLPETVTVTLNTGSTISISVSQWFVSEDELAAYLQTPGDYEILGTTRYGGTCRFILWVLNVNLLEGGSFEADEGIKGYADEDYKITAPGGSWVMNYTKGADRTDAEGNTVKSALQLFVSDNSGNARMGSQSFHFWDQVNVNFTLSQTVDVSKMTTFGNGKYTFSFDIMGGNGANMNIYASITVNYNDGTAAQTVKGTGVELTEWLDWHRATASVNIADISKVASITVTINVYSEVAGTGPWGNIDNCQFYFG